MTSGKPRNSAGRVAIVGTGALGSEFCRLLIEAAEENVLLIDPDCLEEPNVALSWLFRQSREAFGFALGLSKVELIQRMAERRGLCWDVLPVEIADTGWADLRGCDVLVCCADSVLARVETAGAARSLRLPMLDAAVSSGGGSHGRVAYFPADDAQACYLCGLSEQRRAEVLAYAMSPSLGCLPVAGFPGMTGSEQTLQAVAAELFRLLHGSRGDSAFALRLDTKTGSAERISLPRSADCPWHALPPVDNLISLPFDEPIAAALIGGSTLLELFWPICLRTRCQRCGEIAPDRRRAALVRRRGRCPRCGTLGTLEPLECVSRFLTDAPETQLTPRQLGLPARHLYYRRPVAEHRARHTTPP